MNLKKNFTKFVHSDYCFNNRIEEKKLKITKTKIYRMQEHFSKMTTTIYKFNFEKIHIQEHIDNIKFVHSYLVNYDKQLDFDQFLENDEKNFFLEQFELTHEENKGYTPGSVRIFHLFIDKRKKFILYPLFVDFNHSICTQKGKVN